MAYGSFYGMPPNMNGGGYGNLSQPDPSFMHNAYPNNYGHMMSYVNPYNPYQQPQATAYYEDQPEAGGDSIVPPPPMVQAPNGEMVPKKKKKHRKHRKHHKKNKHDRRGRSKSKKKKSDKRSRSRKSKKKKKSQTNRQKIVRRHRHLRVIINYY